jgi:sulfur relay (sulfurtransferase) complex TusBCD TusD component (DsrE family)
MPNVAESPTRAKGRLPRMKLDSGVSGHEDFGFSPQLLARTRCPQRGEYPLYACMLDVKGKGCFSENRGKAGNQSRGLKQGISICSYDLCKVITSCDQIVYGLC